MDPATSVGSESSSVMVPDSWVWPPAIVIVQLWPTWSWVRSEADACMTTVVSGCVRSRMGLPAVSESPAFT